MVDEPADVVIGRLVLTADLQAIHDYLMTRPCNETLDLVLALRQSKPLTREPK